MKRMTKYLYIISFDGLCTLDFDYISSLPNFKNFLSDASYCKNVYSVYPTLTYPAHTSIVTGKYPKNHGIVNNTLFQPNRKIPDWYWSRKYIRGQTLYDIAIDSGMKVAALLWPVTAKSKIQYNLPEIFANRPWYNQSIVSMFNGSPIFEFNLERKFGYLRDGIKQPDLDNFIHRSFIYTIESIKPDITFVHYSELDAMRHVNGFYSKEAKKSLERHDRRLGEIFETLERCNMYKDSTIIVLGDHGSIDESKIININVLLKDNGYIKVNSKGKIISYRAILKNCDGCAYIYIDDKKDENLINEIYSLIDSFNDKYDCIDKIYRNNEVVKLGADPDCSLMLEAKRGFYFLDDVEGKLIRTVDEEKVNRMRNITRATHGYSPYKKNYTTVFIARGKGVKKGVLIDHMNLVDEGPTIAKLLGIDLEGADGRVIDKILI